MLRAAAPSPHRPPRVADTAAPRSSIGAVQLVRLLDGWNRARPVYRALAAALRTLVRDGRVPLSVRLPAERELAAALEISRTTVAAAFELLRAEGSLVSRRGSGSWTALPEGSHPPTLGVSPVPEAEDAPDVIDLGIVAMSAPEPWLSQAAASAVAELPAFTSTHGDFSVGLPALREALAQRYTARGVPTTPDQIMITNGAEAAWVLVLRTTLHPAERVVVDSPSYANALQAIRRAGARPIPVAFDGHRWDLDGWARALRHAAPRLGYVIADFHNPAGHLMSEQQRAELVESARCAGTTLVVDETMADLALDPDVDEGRATLPRPVAAFDRSGSSVLTLGSAGKTFWGGLRIGWIRAAPEMIRRLAAERTSLDLSSPVFEQLVVHRLLTTHLAPALTHQRAQARLQQQALVEEMRARLPEWEFTVPSGGLTLWVHTGGVSGSGLAGAAERLGLRVAAGTRFGVDGTLERFVRVPYSKPPDVTREAVRRLAAARGQVVEGRDAAGIRVL